MSNRKKTTKIIHAGLVCFAVIAVILFQLLNNGIIWFVYPEIKGFKVKGIDVARYQGDIDWQIISSQDISFAYIKATEGSSYHDPWFSNNIVFSRDNGIFAGAYHFFSTESLGITQAENYIKTVSEYQMDLPPVLDFEINTANTKKAADEAYIYLLEIERYFGVKPIIYI